MDNDISVCFATVATKSTDGITLKFDGEATATTKKYKYNKSVSFSVGDRVKVLKYHGTYVVEYKI